MLVAHGTEANYELIFKDGINWFDTCVTSIGTEIIYHKKTNFSFVGT